jgi:hypothetical protein
VPTEHERLLQLYRQRVAGWDVDDDRRGRWLALCRIMLAHGGDLVVPPIHPEPDLDRLLESGAPHGPAPDAPDPGGDCHDNVARLWLDGAVPAVGTGYALSEGLWRQHSWGVHADGTLQETKWPCERYFGVTLPPGEPTVLFVLNAYDGDVKARLRAGGPGATEIIRVMQASRRQARRPA